MKSKWKLLNFTEKCIVKILVSHWPFPIGTCTTQMVCYRISLFNKSVLPRNPKMRLLRLSIFIEIMYIYMYLFFFFFVGRIHSHVRYAMWYEAATLPRTNQTTAKHRTHMCIRRIYCDLRFFFLFFFSSTNNSTSSANALHNELTRHISNRNNERWQHFSATVYFNFFFSIELKNAVHIMNIMTEQ